MIIDEQALHRESQHDPRVPWTVRKITLEIDLILYIMLRSVLARRHGDKEPFQQEIVITSVF